MSIDIDFQSYLSGLTVQPVQENYSSEVNVQPFVIWRRVDGATELFLGGQLGLTNTNVTIDVYGLGPDAAGTLADSLKTTLNGYRGTMGSTPVLAMFVSEANDDYLQKNMYADEGFTLFSFNVQIIS